MIMNTKADKLADYLDDHARSELDNEAAALLRELGRVYAVAREMVYARTHEHSKSAYVEMIDLIKGKRGV
jgi:hypothetical protein